MTSLNDRFKDDEKDGGQRDQAARAVGRDGHGELRGGWQFNGLVSILFDRF